MSTAARRWVCPECGERITAWAEEQDTADAAVVEQVRAHLKTRHTASARHVNSHAQVHGWPAAAGHRVTLWGGPQDGAEVWLPPGPLPPVIGVLPMAAGLEVLRHPDIRRLAGVQVYRCGETVGRDVVRYLHDARTP